MRNNYFKVADYITNSKCLEISPLCNPILPQEHPNSRFLDVFSEDELIENYKNNPTVIKENIVHVDYIHKGQSYKELVGTDIFGLIIASHVIEHVPNLIHWLNEIESVLDNDGILQLAIPDKRYCFDFRRKTTEISDIIGAYLECRTKPSPKIVFDYFLYAHNETQNDPAKHHRGEVSQEFAITKEYLAIALNFARESIDKYIDVHCWVWTPELFLKHMNLLFENNFIKLKVIEEQTVMTKLNTFEFFITMQKC